MEEDETANPVDATFFGSPRIVAQAQDLMTAVEKWRGSQGRHRRTGSGCGTGRIPRGRVALGGQELLIEEPQGGPSVGLLVGALGSGRGFVPEEPMDFSWSQLLRMAESVKADEGSDPADLGFHLGRRNLRGAKDPAHAIEELGPV